MIITNMLQTLCLFIAFYTINSHVVELNKDNFKSLDEFPFALVKFYTTWCGHCKRLAPEWDSAGATLASLDTLNTIFKVNCEEDGDLCKDQGVTGYPTLKVFKYGQVDDKLTIPRESSEIVKFVKLHTSPSFTEIKDKEQFKAFIEKPNTDYKVIAFCESLDDDKCQEFKKLADLKKNYYDFGVLLNNLCETPEYKNHMVIYQPLKLQNKFEKSKISTELSNMKAMKQFLETKLPQLADYRIPDNIDIFVNPLCIAYYTIDYENNAKHSNFWRNRILKTLTDMKLPESEKLKFAVSDKDKFNNEMAEFGFTDTAKDLEDKFKIAPKIGCFGADDKKYVMEKEFSMENLKDFITQFIAGKVDEYYKSEPIPEKNDGPVKVIVYKNFEEEVIKPEKDVLIYFYAPWCGHCKSLEPKFKEAASKLEGEDVIFAKMDATVNELPKGYDVRGYPTMYWLPKGKKDKPIPYEGSREVDGMLKYVSEKATGGLKKFKYEKSEL